MLLPLTRFTHHSVIFAFMAEWRLSGATSVPTRIIQIVQLHMF